MGLSINIFISSSSSPQEIKDMITKIIKNSTGQNPVVNMNVRRVQTKDDPVRAMRSVKYTFNK